VRAGKLVVIETDILIASIDPEDPHHNEASTIIKESQGLLLSPYTLIELDLLIKSGNIKVKDYHTFWYKLQEVLSYYKIKVLTPNPLHHIEADKMRKQYNLTYFDSLHAATAIVEKKPLISYDRKAYSKIESLNYIHPTQYLKQKE